MVTLKEKSFALIEELKKTQVPAVRRDVITFFIRDAERAGEINLYEEYSLNAEALTFERQSYMLPAWKRKVGILDLLPLLNMKMMALLFQEEAAAKMWESWGMEAYNINCEIRPHYILDKFQSFLHAEDHPQLLEELLKVRDSRHHPFSKGPYHDEYFPYDLCRYEELLLGKKRFSQDEKVISSEIEELLVEICMIQDE